MTDATSPVRDAVSPQRLREHRARRAARWRWAIGIAVALVFHVGLIALTRVGLVAEPRVDRVDGRVWWLGDRIFLEGEDSLRGQELAIFRDDPLFLVTGQNFAGRRPPDEETRPPGQIFSRFDPVLVMPTDRSPPGLVTAPTDQLEPASALQGFRWHYFSRFDRGDPVERAFEPRRARIEVFAMGSGAKVWAESLPLESNPEAPEVWPDWRPFEISVTVSDTGRLSEPLMVGGGSGSDVIDRTMREYVRRRMRLDLRLGPGNYRVSIGP